MRGRLVALYLSLIALCYSCGSSDVVIMQDVNIGSWDEQATICFENEQAGSLYDIDIVLHVNSNYSTKSCQMEIAVTAPDSLSTSEIITLHTPLEAKSPAAKARDIVVPYRRRIEMTQSGAYNYTLRPVTPLSDVESVGIVFKPQNR